MVDASSLELLARPSLRDPVHTVIRIQIQRTVIRIQGARTAIRPIIPIAANDRTGDASAKHRGARRETDRR